MQTLDEIIFENRNKNYGTFYLRTHYSDYLSKAFITSVLAFGVIMKSSFYLVPRNIISVMPITQDRIWKKIPENELLIPLVKEEKRENQITEKRKLKVNQYVPPITVNDTKETPYEPPTIHQLETGIIGTKNEDDPEDVGAFNNFGNVDQAGELMTPIVEAPKVDESTKVFVKAEVHPEFKGGIEKMYKWLGKNLNYPAMAQKNGISGRVIVNFIVEGDGGISGIEILKGIGFGCDDEAKRVIGKMPK